jgi:hypothetical protein
MNLLNKLLVRIYIQHGDKLVKTYLFTQTLKEPVEWKYEIDVQR